MKTPLALKIVRSSALGAVNDVQQVVHVALGQGAVDGNLKGSQALGSAREGSQTIQGTSKQATWQGCIQVSA